VDLSDALIITFFGISVVFIGLILTSLLIFSFSHFPRLFQKIHKPVSKKVVPPETVFQEPLEPDIIAVIATVLEVELRLYHTHHGHRLTMSGHSRSAAGSDTGETGKIPLK